MSEKKRFILLTEFILAVVVAIIPFTPKIYNFFFIEPEHSFIYETNYMKNPMMKFDRTFEDIIKIIDYSKIPYTPNQINYFKKIAKEGFRLGLDSKGKMPFDTMEVEIVNISRYDLKNIKVHFTDCVGYNSFSCWPDVHGNAANGDLKALNPTDTVTIKYDMIPRYNRDFYSNAYIKFIGEDASKCEPIVEALLSNDKSAIGKKVLDISKYLEEKNKKSKYYTEVFDIIWKLLVSLVMIYLFIQIRSVKRMLFV